MRNLILAFVSLFLSTAAAHAQWVPFTPTYCAAGLNQGCMDEATPESVTAASLQQYWQQTQGNAPMPIFPSDTNVELANLAKKAYAEASANGAQASALVMSQSGNGMNLISVMFVLKKGGITAMNSDLATTYLRY